MRHPRVVANSLIVLALSGFVLLSPTEPTSAQGTAVAVVVGQLCGVCFDPFFGQEACPGQEEQEFHCEQQCGYGNPGQCVTPIEEWLNQGWDCNGSGEYESGWTCGSGGGGGGGS